MDASSLDVDDMASNPETLVYRFYLDRNMHTKDRRELTYWIQKAEHRVVDVLMDKKMGPRRRQYAASFLICDPQNLPMSSDRVLNASDGAEILVLHYYFARKLLNKRPLLHPGPGLNKFVKKFCEESLFTRTWYGAAWKFWLDPDIDEDECFELTDKIEVIHFILSPVTNLAELLSTREGEA